MWPTPGKGVFRLDAGSRLSEILRFA